MALNLAKSNLTKPDGNVASSTSQMFTIDKLLYQEKKEKRSAFAFCNEKRRTSFESLKFDASMASHHTYPDFRHHDFSRAYSLGWTDPWFRMVRNGTHPYFTSLPDVGVHRGHGFKPMKSETPSKLSSYISSKPAEEELSDDDSQLVGSAADDSPPKEEKQTIVIESRQRLCIKKKTRTVFSRAQVFHLEAAFDLKRYLSSSERTSLAAALRLSETQIKVWFQNRRNKWKRQFTTEPDSCTALCPDAKVLPITIFGRDAAYLAAVDAMAKKEHSMLYSALTR